MGGGSGGTQTTEQRPLEELQPFITPALENLAFQLQQPRSFAPEGSPLLAGFNPTQNFAFNTLAPQAIAGQQGAANQAQGALDFTFNQMLDPATNPALQRTADAAVNTVFRGLNEQVIPGIQDQAILAGGVGGSEANQAVGSATERSVDQALAATSGIFNSAYQNSLNNFTQTLLGLPNVQAGIAQPLNTALQIGGQQQAQEQAGIDAARQEHQFNQVANLQQLQNFAALLLGAPPGQIITPGPTTNPWLQGAGAGLSAYGATGNPYLAAGAGAVGFLS